MPLRGKRHDMPGEAPAHPVPRTPERRGLRGASSQSAASGATSAAFSASSSRYPAPITLDGFAQVRRYAYEGMNDKDSYSIDDKEGAALAGTLLHPTIVRQMAVGRHFKSLTYGEVLPHSIQNDVIPALRMQAGDVFYDLGSGTGLIPLQVALARPELAASKGVEFALARHQSAERALTRLRGATDAVYDAMTLPLGSDRAAFKSCVQHALTRLSVVHGSFLEVDITDATVVFINNTVFEASVMLPLLQVLATLPNLKRVCVIRPLCGRHGARCVANGSACCAFMFPPTIDKAHPTWCETVPIYTYERIHSGALSAASASVAARDMVLPSPPRVARSRASAAVPAGTSPARASAAAQEAAVAATAAVVDQDALPLSSVLQEEVDDAAALPPGDDDAGKARASSRPKQRRTKAAPAEHVLIAKQASGTRRASARIAAGGSPARPSATVM